MKKVFVGLLLAMSMQAMADDYGYLTFTKGDGSARSLAVDGLHRTNGVVFFQAFAVLLGDVGHVVDRCYVLLVEPTAYLAACKGRHAQYPGCFFQLGHGHSYQHFFIVLHASVAISRAKLRNYSDMTKYGAVRCWGCPISWSWYTERFASIGRLSG